MKMHFNEHEVYAPIDETLIVEHMKPSYGSQVQEVHLQGKVDAILPCHLNDAKHAIVREDVGWVVSALA